MKAKKLIALIFLILLVMPLSFAAAYPKHTNDFFVNDFANVLPASAESELMANALALFEATGAQLVVVTVESLDGQDLESYARGLFNEWGIGDAKKKNGVLLLVSVSDRKSRIEVGYGLEGALNDALTGRIQDDFMIEHFRSERYDLGLLGGASEVADRIYAEYGIEKAADMTYYNPISSPSEEGEFTIFHLIGLVVLVVLMILDIAFNRGRLTRFVLYTMARSSRGGKGGGGYRGGGGRSGGGGSSRSW